MGLENLPEIDLGNTGEDEESDGLASFLEKKQNGLGSFLESKLNGDGSSSGDVQYKPEIHFGSSEDMSEVPDESVDLIVTSPPYNTGWDYGSVDDSKDYIREYLPMLAKVFTECHRVLRPSGRMCVNVPSLLRSGASGGYPIAADIQRLVSNGDGVTLDFVEDNMHGTVRLDFPERRPINKLRTTTNFVIREQVTWVKPFNHDGLAPNGSFPRPWGILLNNMHEVITIFQKPGDRTYEDMSEERIESSKVDKTADDMCDDVWRIQPDSWSPQYIEEEDIPVFPEELVRRCISLWSYKGDTVLDPFAGRFTVGKVAKEESRESIGYELREDLERDIREFANLEQAGLSQFV